MSLILEQIEQAEANTGHRPDSVPLTDYPTPDDYYRVLGNRPGYTWKEHCMINKAARRILSRHKIKTELRTIQADDFLGWCTLQGRDNTPAARAAYIAGQ